MIQKEVFLQRHFTNGFTLSCRFEEGDKFIKPEFVDKYRFLERTNEILEDGTVVYGSFDESTPWIENPNAK